MQSAKRLVILVEGDSELDFMQAQIIPFLYRVLEKEIQNKVSWSIEAFKIVTNRQLNKKGGNISFTYLENELRRLASQGCTLVTTFVDFFRLPTDFPFYTTDSAKVDDIQKAMKERIAESVPAFREFHPYIQLHEFEALLFSDIKGFELVLDDQKQLEEIAKIQSDFPNPEDINGGAQTAPSKRLAQIFNYDKIADSGLILEEIGLKTIRDKCPRFRVWLDGLARELIRLSNQ